MAKNTDIKFPRVPELSFMLARHQLFLEEPEESDEEGDEEISFWGDEGEDGSCIEVRLQVVDGSWYLHTGDPCFDTDHRGFWGSGYLTADTDCRELAYELIEEAKDHAAFEASIDRDEES